MEQFTDTGAMSAAGGTADPQGMTPVSLTALVAGQGAGRTDAADPREGEVTPDGAAGGVGDTARRAAPGAPGAEDTGETRDSDAAAEESAADAAPTDYAALAAEDLREIKRMAPSLAGLTHLAELPNALRYAALRDAGLSVEEALYAACHAFVTPRAADNRAHLRSAVPIGAAGTPSRMTAAEMREARELFGDLTEGEIERLYARCQPE